MARRGAGVLGEDKQHAGEKDTSASKLWREAVQRARGELPTEEWQPETFVEADDAPSPRREPRAVPPRPRRERKTGADRLPPDVAGEVRRAGGQRGWKLAERLAEATKAYERDRYQDARRILRPVVDQAPDAAPARELLGLTQYRLGNWRAAIKELEAFHALSSSYDQHPVLADCYRALGRRKHVERVWDELRKAGVGAEVLAEGRIVMAGALADGDDVAGAVELLERSGAEVRRPKLHHLRLWYALADLYERAGNIQRARELFARIHAHDEEFHDVAARLRGLR